MGVILTLIQMDQKEENNMGLFAAIHEYFKQKDISNIITTVEDNAEVI